MTTGSTQPRPAENSTRITADGDLEYADKDGNWIRYEDPPTFLSGEDTEPGWLEKGEPGDDGDDEDAGNDG